MTLKVITGQLVSKSGLAENKVFHLPASDVDQYGISALATILESEAGVLATKTVTPAGLQGMVGFLNVKGFGAVGDGVTNDKVAIQAAIDAAKAASTAETKPTVYFPAGKYKLLTGITVYCGEVSLQGDGSILDFSGAADGTTCITVEQDSYTWRRHNYSSPTLCGLSIRGNGEAGTSVGIYAHEATALRNQNPDFQNIAIDGFGNGIKLGDNTWGVQFLSCDIVNCGVAIKTVTGATNAGERISFVNCLLAENTIVVVNDGDFMMHFTNCSLDYNDKIVASGVGRVLFFANCHLESNVLPWFTITTGSLCFSNCVLWYSMGLTTNPIVAFSTPSGYLGPLASFTNCWVVASTENIIRLTTGTGRVQASGISYVSNSAITPLAIVCAADSRCTDGGFEGNGLGWVLDGGGTPATISTDQAHSGTKSLKLANEQMAKITIAYRMGALISGEFWVYSNTAGVYDLFESGVFRCLSNNGTELGTLVPTYFPTSLALNTWERIGFRLDVGPVPPGTEKLWLGFSNYNGAGIIFYIDDVVVNVYG